LFEDLPHDPAVDRGGAGSVTRRAATDQLMGGSGALAGSDRVFRARITRSAAWWCF
jgi:hypothetical protein